MLSTLRADTSAGIDTVNEQQGMCMSANGWFIYTQAHGCNLLLVLAVDGETGRLRQIQAVPVQSKWPRCVALSPDGRFLIQCCLDGEMRVYAVGADGTLTTTPHHADVQGGAFVSFYAPEA